MKRNISITVLIVIALAVIIISVNKQSNLSDREGVKIGVLTPLSGPIAVAGEVQKNAISMALEDLRSAGIDTSMYQLVYEDSKYDPKTSLSGYESLKLKGARIIIADGSPVVAAIREKAVQDGIMIFAQSATTPVFTDTSPLTCRVGLTADILGPSVSAYASELSYNKLAIFVPNNEYGTVMRDAIVSSFTGKIVKVELYDQTSGDLRSNVLKLLQYEKDVDALVVINNITPEPMFKQLAELGWDKPILSDIWTITSPNMKDRTVANGTRFVDYIYTPQVALNRNPNAMRYAQSYQTKYNAVPILLGALTYDSLNILVAAIQEEGGDPQKIAKALVKMPAYQGITGEIKFDSSCQNINTGLTWREVLANGSFTDIK
ncbi:MAG: ABC transporter substrate-binding protein [Candidatus Paceibacterota bacterium]